MVEQTGFIFDESVQEAITAIKTRKAQWVICQIPDGKDSGCVLSCEPYIGTGDNEADFEAFIAAMPEDKPRWAVYALNFVHKEVNKTVIALIRYIPEGTDSRSKFAYAHNQAKMSAKVNPKKQIFVSDKCDVTREKFIEECT